MGQAGKKGGVLSFILFIPQWTKIKDPDKIERRSNNISSTCIALANAQLLNSNRPKILPKARSLSIIYNLKNELSDSESLAGLETDYNLDEEADIFFEVLVMDTDLNRK